MRLHELRITAIGPFVDEQVIDFDRLSASGLFLLEGPTGVGKSTVIDAVTFALYGSVTGVSTDGGRLRSDFADPAVTPRVQLELSVRGRRLRITRTPEHERPKRRGSGTTVERGTAHLEEWQNGAWVSRSHRQDEIGTQIGDQLGLTREQFRQVVVLPQGEFTAFLRADDDGRRAVLVKLFGTQFYEKVMLVLQGRAAQARLELKASEADLSARIDAAWEAIDRAPDEDPGRPLTWEQQVADLESVQVRAAAEALTATRSASEAQHTEDVARLVASEAREVADRVASRDALVAELDAAEAERGDQERRRRRMDQALRARPVRPLLELLEAARSRASETLAGVKRLGLGDAAGEADLRAAQLREEASVADGIAGGLRHVVALEAGLGLERAALATAEEDLDRQESASRDLRRRISEVPQQLTELAGLIEHARSEVAAAEAAEREVTRAERRRDAAAQSDALEARLLQLRADERAARRLHEATGHTVAVVLDQRLAGLQGELAAQLVSGDPCLVCGSVDHPSPAATDRRAVTEEQLREAVAGRDDALARWETVSGELANTQAKQAAAGAVADGISAGEASAWVAELTALAATLPGARSTMTRLLGEEFTAVTLQSELQSELVRCVAGLATDRAEVTRRRAALATSDAQVLQERDGHSSVAARCVALRDRAAQAVEGAQALEEHHRAGAALTAGQAHALCEARSAGFADLETALEWVLPERELAELEATVRAWEGRLQTIHAQLSSAPFAAVAGLTAPLAGRWADATEEVLRAATARARVAAAHATRARHSAELLDRLMVAVAEAAQERARRAAASADLCEVEAYVRGNAGVPRMTLSTFVLRYWFDHVVAAANVRLQAMSAGKYELLRVEQGARASSRVGLGLAILDRHTGRERGTETLSGGESFYTSLSLALGLADVVVAEAGGAQLDTLFIDEGFGSLDPNTLDEVMTVIDDLRGHGRVVGIVSHVSELKERISERLTIRRVRPDGPSCVELVA